MESKRGRGGEGEGGGGGNPERLRRVLHTKLWSRAREEEIGSCDGEKENPVETPRPGITAALGGVIYYTHT